MTSKKLKKYLAYYQKTLREEPENIEARLRLAAVFRDMGREGHAIEEYGTASRLLARQGLALEAIAACKAILELDPRHTETQLFLARMYARAPDAAGPTARIARPLQRPVETGSRAPSRPTHSGRSAGEPIELGRPKEASKLPSLPTLADPGPDPDELTAVGPPDANYQKLFSGKDAPAGSAPPPVANVPDDARHTVEMDASDRATVLREMYDAAVGDADVDTESEPLSPQAQDLLFEQARLRRTQDVDEDDILLEEVADITVVEGASRQLPDLDDEPITDELSVSAPKGRETFEAPVFDMASLRLEAESSGEWDDLSFLDELEEPATSEVFCAPDTNAAKSSQILSVDRADLPRIPLFSQLDAQVFTRLLTLMDYRIIDADTYVIEPGRAQPSLFVIVHGRVVVERVFDDGSTLELAEMGEGEFFGEFALLTGRSESASVRADGELTVLEVRQEVLQLIAQDHPEIWDVLWDFYYARMLNNLLASSTIFRSMTDTERRELTARFVLREVPRGDLLARQGAQDDDLYLICFGEVQVEHARGGEAPRLIDTLREGEFVGLISSVSQEPVIADLRATSDTTLLVLPGEDFRRAVRRSPQVEREVRAVVRRRKDAAHRYTSGVTSYAELGVAPRQADSTDAD